MQQIESSQIFDLSIIYKGIPSGAEYTGLTFFSHHYANLNLVEKGYIMMYHFYCKNSLHGFYMDYSGDPF